MSRGGMTCNGSRIIIGQGADRAGRRYRLIEDLPFRFEIEVETHPGLWEREEWGDYESIRWWGQHKWKAGERKLLRDLRLRLRGSFARVYQHMHPDARVIGAAGGSALYAGSPMHNFYVWREIAVWAVPDRKGKVWIVVRSWYLRATEGFEPEGYLIGHGTKFDVEKLAAEAERVTRDATETFLPQIDAEELEGVLRGLA